MPKAKKSLGQNFLIDPAVTNQILQLMMAYQNLLNGIEVFIGAREEKL